jgi:uncharacterized lipoprotein YehR (DUF1307 family)
MRVNMHNTKIIIFLSFVLVLMMSGCSNKEKEQYGYSKNDTGIYYRGNLLESANPETFIILNNTGSSPILGKPL